MTFETSGCSLVRFQNRRYFLDLLSLAVENQLVSDVVGRQYIAMQCLMQFSKINFFSLCHRLFEKNIGVWWNEAGGRQLLLENRWGKVPQDLDFFVF